MINRDKRGTLKLLGLSPLAFPGVRLLSAEAALTRIAFGSCMHQDKPQLIWDAVLASSPELFVFLGDNIYGDSDDPVEVAKQYQKLAAQPGFVKLRASTDTIAIWDDHDYGRNDAGSEYPAKEASRQLFHDFWGEPQNSAARSRADGSYSSKIYGPAGQRVQVLMPDLRWNRSPLLIVLGVAAHQVRDAADMGPYMPDPSGNARLLGEDQWNWLEAEFNKPAEVRIFSSSIQVLANFTGWETWANFPVERNRLLRLLDSASDSINLIISGDVHWCEYSLLQRAGNVFAHAELTSSGLTETWDKISPNRHRVGQAFAVPNFGLIEIDWSGSHPTLQLSVRNESSALLIQHTYPI